jgi:predicted phosphodiesterase
MKIKKAIIWPDTHAPYHDKRACSVAMQIGRKFKPDTLLFAGDFFDCYAVSRFDKSPDKAFRYLEQELVPGFKLRDAIIKTCKPKDIVWLQGNHEQRIQKYINVYAPLLADKICVKEILEIPKSWKYYEYDQKGIHKLGPLLVTHGFFCNKYAAQKHLDHYKTNIIFCHTHRVQTASSRLFLGGPIQAFNIGWLGDAVKAGEYSFVPPDWAQAITLVEYTTKNFTVNVIPINNGKAIFNGKIIRG